MKEITLTATATVKKMTLKEHRHRVRSKEQAEAIGKPVNKGLGVIGLTVNSFITIDISVGGTILRTRKVKFSTMLESDEFKSFIKTFGNEDAGAGRKQN